jgi:hypothetical protein
MADQALRAVVLRTKRWRIIESDDGGENIAATCSVPPIRLRSDGRLDGKLACLPADADAEALMRLSDGGFNFSKPRLIEFNVHFSTWPPHREAMARLARDYPSAAVCVTDDDRDGYLEFQVYALLSYELIKNIQSYVTELMSPYRGVCSSWEILPTSS